MDAATTFTPFDWALLSLLVVSIAVGAWRGLITEVMSLAGWVIAYFAAPWLAPVLLPWVHLSQPEWNGMAALVLAFVLILMVCGIVTRLVRFLVHATPLVIMDRVLGAGFGLLRGVLVLLLAAVLMGFTPWRDHPAWLHSSLRPVLHSVLRLAAPLLPEGLQPFLQTSRSSSNE